MTSLAEPPSHHATKGRTLRPSLTRQHHVKGSDEATRVAVTSSQQQAALPSIDWGPPRDTARPIPSRQGLTLWPVDVAMRSPWGQVCRGRLGAWTQGREVYPAESFGSSGGRRLQGNCSPTLRAGRHHGLCSGSRPGTWTSCAPGRLTVEASRAFRGVLLQPQGSGTVESHVRPGREASP